MKRRTMKIQNRSFNVVMSLITGGAALVGAVCFGVIGASRANATIEYQEEVDMSFTFGPAIGVTVSGGLTIDDLVPGGDPADSNIITVGASTNVSSGYTLTATVGAKGGTDKLVNDSNAQQSYYFDNLTSAVSTLSGFGANEWGYSYSTDGGTTWVNGSVGSTTAGYAGLPLDNNDSADEKGSGGVTLITSSSEAQNAQTVKFKIAAKAAATQPAGAYTNTINFYAVTNAVPE